MKKIAVIGAGGTGVALSAILASKGHEVYLADNLNQTVVEATQEAGVLRTKGTKVCEGRPALVTSNIEEAVRRAELIVCCTISNRDEEIARTLAPVVTKDQAVLVGAGNCATIVYHKIFEAAGKKTGVIGTTGLVYAGKKIDPALTTPDPAFLQKTLADMRDHGVEYAFLEVSAHAVHYEKIAGIPFYARIFTNCTQDHLDFFKTMERYARTKESFFLNAESDGFFVVNTDDGTGRKIADGLKMQGKKAFTYGLENPSDAFAVIADESPAGSRCLMNFSDTLCRVAIPLAGRHNVYNALAAASLAFLAGIPPETIAAGLKNAVPPRGRLQRICGVPGAEIFIDFAHTPDGLEKSLNAVRPFCKGKLYCLFGCGGNRDHTKRPKMGEVAAKNADFSYLTSDNPRNEDPCDIIRSIEAGYRRFSDRYVCIPDRKKAIFYAVDRLKKGDVLLIAGKGGEEYQEIMGVKYEYDDESVTEEAIFSRGGKG